MGKPKKGGDSEMPTGKGAKAQAQKNAAKAAKGKQQEAAQEAAQSAKWAEGSKDSSKKEAAEAKKREAAAKKAERDAELAAENASLKTTKTNPKAGAKGKAPAPRAGGLDAALSSFDAPSGSKAATLNASGIDNALDALSLTAQPSSQSVERHPERRFKAAYMAYEERRMAEGKADGEWDGLRQNQVKDRIRKEFERSPENPFNQVSVAFDATKQELAAAKKNVREEIEGRLGDRS